MAAVRRIDPVSKYVEETLPAECGEKHIRGTNRSCPLCRVARGGVEWVSAPPEPIGRTMEKPAWLPILRERPGEWALVEMRPTKSSAKNRKHTLKKSPALRGYEIAWRGCSIYARFLGEQP